MPELRQNVVTKEWVIIANERAKRPNSFTQSLDARIHTHEHPESAHSCPFCPGNEELDLEVERFPTNADSDHWQTRVVRNKYPALAEDGAPIRKNLGVHRSITGVGYHDVVIDHPKHNTTFALMQPMEIYQVFRTFQRRGFAMSQDHRVEHIIYFKNHGERAGASLQHPHSQIIGLPVVPNNVRRRIEESRRYTDDSGECVLCKMLEDELHCGERIIVENDHFVAFVLYAALSPFHMWIVPRYHRDSFLDSPEKELLDLSRMIRTVLYKVYYGLADPDFNMIIRAGPVRERGSASFHWYISLVLRVSRMAGFEMGSGMHINPCSPEESAAFLRDQPEPSPS
jgi:UDPglucose--hexose-1-phosphate uridylyltransferase